MRQPTAPPVRRVCSGSAQIDYFFGFVLVKQKARRNGRASDAEHHLPATEVG